MAVPRLYLDTNILIYAFENNDARAKKLLQLIALNEGNSDPFLAISEMALAELIVHPLRTGNHRLTELYENICLGNAFIRVGVVSREVLWMAGQLRAEHVSLRLPDAIHVSTAMLFGCALFLSADTRLKSSYVLQPAALAPYDEPATIWVVRPDISTLDQLIHEAAI